MYILCVCLVRVHMFSPLSFQSRKPATIQSLGPGRTCFCISRHGAAQSTVKDHPSTTPKHMFAYFTYVYHMTVWSITVHVCTVVHICMTCAPMSTVNYIVSFPTFSIVQVDTALTSYIVWLSLPRNDGPKRQHFPVRRSRPQDYYEDDGNDPMEGRICANWGITISNHSNGMDQNDIYIYIYVIWYIIWYIYICIIWYIYIYMYNMIYIYIYNIYIYNMIYIYICIYYLYIYIYI